MWLLLCALGGQGHCSCHVKSPSRLRRHHAFSGLFAWLSWPSASAAFSATCVASAIWLIVVTSTSVASVAFVGASCTSLAVAIAVVAITAVIVAVATTRATPHRLCSQGCSRAIFARDHYCQTSWKFLCRVDARCARQSSSSRRFSALAHRQAVAFLLVVVFDASNLAAIAATITIVAITIIVVLTAMRPSLRLPSHSGVFLSTLAQRLLLARLLSRAR